MVQESKGQTTKNNILREGLALASVNGLVNISIGSLATQSGMSRSGLFAHFLSKEQLQIEIVEHAFGLFKEIILDPCDRISSPIEKLYFLQKNVASWYDNALPPIPGGCLFLTACQEFDDRPGKVRDLLLSKMSIYIEYIKNIHDQAVELKEFGDHTDRAHFAYVFYSLYMGYNQYRRFFGDDHAREHYNFTLSRLIQHAQQSLINSGQ